MVALIVYTPNDNPNNTEIVHAKWPWCVHMCMDWNNANVTNNEIE